MNDLSALFETTEPAVPKLGGKRARAGNKKQKDRAVDPDSNETEYQKYERGRARKELALAAKEEVAAALADKTVVLRSAVVEQTAKAFAMCSQSLDSIPDDCEQQLGLDPEICLRIRDLIDATKAALAADLKSMCETGMEEEFEEGDDQ